MKGTPDRKIVSRSVASVLGTTMALLMLTSPLPAQEAGRSPESQQMRSAARQAGLPEAQLPQATPAELRRQKAELESWEQKIPSSVRDRMAAIDAGLRVALTVEEWLQVDDRDRIFLELKVEDATIFDEKYFAEIGGRLHQRALGYGLLTAWVPAHSVQKIAQRRDVRLIRAVGPAEVNVGAVTSEGDAIHNADQVRAVFGLSGAGQLVGAISNGVDSMAAAQASGDLPAMVNVPPGCAGGGDEGTAMLEIIFDLVPGAALAFCGGGGGATGMINAINALAALPGMTAITDDLILADEPLYEDGDVADAKANAVAAGIFYTASAGNRGGQHYQNNYNSPNANVIVGPNSYSNPHDFGGGDVQLSITLAASNSIRMQWAEPFGAAAIDLDLYVVDNAGNVLGSSTDTQNGTQDPAERVSFNATAGTAANIIVDYVGGGAPPTVFFDLRAFGGVGWNEYLVPAGSLDPVARQPEIYVAGAAAANSQNTVRGFSSRGPALELFPGPAVSRLKPDGIGIDRNLITGAGGFGGGTCPIVNPGDVCRFSGTSASTPHVAALAALLIEDQPTLTPAQVANAFNTTAVDIDAPGPDNNAGFGRLDVFAAVCSFDDDPPDITCPDDAVAECTELGGTPSDDPQLDGFFDGVSAEDECTDSPEISDNAPGLFPVGPTAVTFTASDDNDNEATCDATVTVEDSTPPELSLPDAITLKCNGPGGVAGDDPQIVAWLDSASAEDICEGPTPVTNNAPPLFEAGCAPGAETVVTFSSSDSEDNNASDDSSVFVEDTTAPSVSCGVATGELWPPNHKMVDVGFGFEATDICDTEPLAIEITVTSDEDAAEELGAGGPIHCPDAIIGDDGSVQLRAERSGAGDGRVYSITVSATDACGNVGTCSVPVSVPHSKGPGGAAVDSGQAFDATVCNGILAFTANGN